ncbi:hypothetical protein NHX12_024178 [Muraenolepis orangiensis]|uniref:Uncharacterized protein n=1 Tax=Muraenolepis orangiensis TaxID=630683 RepID=A0A9Q0ESA3_9TELE|nr:hypothetical protein NHX12_024178 [Muraenolepis orangiensis]
MTCFSFSIHQTLQRDTGDLGTFRRVVDQVFKRFPDGQGFFMDPGPRRCRSCSVVGNSGNLQSSHYGSVIDFSDVVFSTYQSVKAKIKANKDLVMILNPEFMKYVYEIWLANNGSYPSTGFLGLMLAMHICDEVSVFGFGVDQNGNWRHYWEELKDKTLGTGVHSGKEEYKLIETFAAKGKITFFPGR